MHSVVRSLTRSLTLASTLGHSFQLGGAPKFARGAAAAAAMSSSTVETTRNVKQPGSILRVISLSPEPSYTVGVQATWPFTEADLRRHDEMSDAEFYSQPRFVHHIDNGCIDSLRDDVYGELFEQGDDVLDVCSSWVSHFPDPDTVDLGLVIGLGMNEAELKANSRLTSFVVQDLNREPVLPFEDRTFDKVTNAVSVDYLAKPRELFREFHRVLRPGGLAIMSFSNRMFPTKVVNMWLQKTEEELL